MAAVSFYGTVTSARTNMSPFSLPPHLFAAAVDACMVIGVACQNSRTVDSVQWDASGDNDTFIKREDQDLVGNSTRLTIWTLHEDDLTNVLPQTKNIEISLSGMAGVAAGVGNFDNVDPTTPMANLSGQASGNNQLITVDITGASNDDMGIDVVAAFSTPVAGAGQTELWNLSQNGNKASSREPISGTTTMSWDLPSVGQWGTIAAAIKAKAGAPGGAPTIFQLQRDRTLARVLRM